MGDFLPALDRQTFRANDPFRWSPSWKTIRHAVPIRAGPTRLLLEAPGNSAASDWDLFLKARLWVLGVALIVGFTIWGYTCIGPTGRIVPGHTDWHRTDFTVFTEAGAAFFDGRNPYRVANPRGWHYLYPPLFALLVAPLSFFDTESQVRFWYAVNVAFSSDASARPDDFGGSLPGRASRVSLAGVLCVPRRGSAISRLHAGRSVGDLDPVLADARLQAGA